MLNNNKLVKQYTDSKCALFIMESNIFPITHFKEDIFYLIRLILLILLDKVAVKHDYVPGKLRKLRTILSNITKSVSYNRSVPVFCAV